MADIKTKNKKRVWESESITKNSKQGINLQSKLIKYFLTSDDFF